MIFEVPIQDPILSFFDFFVSPYCAAFFSTFIFIFFSEKTFFVFVIMAVTNVHAANDHLSVSVCFVVVVPAGHLVALLVAHFAQIGSFDFVAFAADWVVVRS